MKGPGRWKLWLFACLPSLWLACSSSEGIFGIPSETEDPAEESRPFCHEAAIAGLPSVLTNLLLVCVCVCMCAYIHVYVHVCIHSISLFL